MRRRRLASLLSHLAAHPRLPRHDALEISDAYVAVAANQALPVEVAERLEVPSGRYQVYLSLVESIRELDANRNVVREHSPLCGKAVSFAVK